MCAVTVAVLVSEAGECSVLSAGGKIAVGHVNTPQYFQELLPQWTLLVSQDISTPLGEAEQAVYNHRSPVICTRQWECAVPQVSTYKLCILSNDKVATNAHYLEMVHLWQDYGYKLNA